MNTQHIIDAIDRDFAKTYRGAANFIDSGAVWNFCMETIKDPVLMSNIAFANDLEVPPVKSLLLIYKRKMTPAEDFKFDSYESRSIGALMGFVFKFVLGYKDQKERCKVGQYGIQTATRFLDGPFVEFTE
jgi:hypothetical protein